MLQSPAAHKSPEIVDIIRSQQCMKRGHALRTITNPVGEAFILCCADVILEDEAIAE